MFLNTSFSFGYTQLSAPNGFAKSGWQIRAICHKENEKSGSQSRVPQAKNDGLESTFATRGLLPHFH